MKGYFDLSVLAVGLAMLCGCGTYKKFSPSEIEPLFPAIPSQGQDTVDVAALPWQQFFTDSLLQYLINTALENNADLAIARQRVIQAEAVLRSAKLAYLPSLNLTAEAGASRFQGETSRTFQLGGAASWELDIFGKLTAEKRSAAESAEATRAYRQAVQTQTIASVAATYYALAMQDSQLSLVRETLENWREMERTFEALKLAGRANEPALLQARANALMLEGEVLTLEQQRAETANALCSLLCVPLQEIIRSPFSSQIFPEDFAKNIPLSALRERPDVRQAEHTLAAAFYTDRAALAAFFPSITISGSAGWTNAGLAIGNPASWLVSALGSITQPLFNRGQLKANKTVTAAQQEEAKIEFRQTLLVAAQEVADAQTALQTAVARLGLDNERIATLEEAVRKTELLMRHSGTSYLEVLTAKQDLLSARQTLLEDQLARTQAIITLYHALGGGIF